MASMINSPTFLPTQIAGLAAWFDAADRSTISTTISTTGTVVVQWNDKSGRGFRATESGSPYVNPIYSSTLWNGQPVVSFNNSNSEMQINNIQFSNQGRSIFTVYQVPTYIGNRGIALLTRFQTTFQQFAIGAVNIVSLAANGIASAAIATSNGWNNTNINIISAVHSANSTNNTININGTPQTLYLNCNAGSYATTSYTAQLGTGFSRNINYGVPFNLGEIIQYSNDLTLSQTQQVEGYLAWKWGLQSSLPTSHPFYYNQGIPNLILPQQLRNPFRLTNNSVFVPTQVSSCSLWLDASDANSVIRTGNNVTAWNDKSGNGNNATAFSNPQYVPNIRNGLGSILFNGTSSYMSIPGTQLDIATEDFAVFAVIQYTSTVNQIPIIGKNVGITSNQWRFAFDQNNSYQIFIFKPSVSAVSQTTYNTSGWGLFNSVVYRSTSLQAFINGTGLTAGGTISGTLSDTTANVDIGRGWGSGIPLRYFNSYMSEIILYKGTINATQRQQVEGYLSWKWGLQSNLPTSHPFYFNQGISNLRLPQPLANPFRLTNSSGFDPRQINGLNLWLDAADSSSVITSNLSVTQWNDKSANGKNATGTVSAYPTYDRTNRRIVFNGSNSYLSNIGFSFNLSQRSVFLVIQETNYTQFGGILAIIPNPTSGTDYLTTTGMSYETYLGFRVYQNNNGYINDMSIGNPLPLSIYYEQMNGTSGSSFRNGNLNSNRSASFTAGSCGGYLLGTRWVSGDIANFYYTGYMHEIIIFSNTLTTPQRQQVEGYLAWKWGLQKSLPRNHPFFIFPPG